MVQAGTNMIYDVGDETLTLEEGAAASSPSQVSLMAIASLLLAWVLLFYLDDHLDRVYSCSIFLHCFAKKKYPFQHCGDIFLREKGSGKEKRWKACEVWYIVWTCCIGR
uniref:Uncharacterized protein n=1 Tax=Aegilops tauschii subsp. strangulata TaxID=200361 RepID=A0A453QCA0_AEGTS